MSAEGDGPGMTACSGSGAPTCQFFTGLFIQQVFLKSPSVAGTLLGAGVTSV